MNALCLASLAGNSHLDAVQISDSVNDILIDALSKKLPYSRKIIDAESEKPKETNFDKYFAQLEELKKELEEKNKEKQKSEDSQQKVDTSH
jgi:hypothetical protein